MAQAVFKETRYSFGVWHASGEWGRTWLKKNSYF